MFDPNNDPLETEIDFRYTRLYDHSALEAVKSLSERYDQAGKTLSLSHLSPDCLLLLNMAEDWTNISVSSEPHYHIATERLS